MNKIKTLALVAAAFTSFSVQAQKNLGMESSPNFRELGGLQINEKYQVKEGVLYRSGSFSHLPDRDVEILESTGINRVVDFRSPFEIEREPDHIPASLNAEYVPCQIGSINPNAMGGFMKVLSSPDFQKSQVDSLMVMANKGFVESISDYTPLFESIQEKESVVLFHCSAGKDRTGFASSLILHILGADWDTIMADFLRSNEAVEKLDTSKLEMYGIPTDRAKLLGGVEPEYLEAAWAEIEQKYGSVDTMLEEVFGIGKKEKKALRKKYLEKI